MAPASALARGSAQESAPATTTPGAGAPPFQPPPDYVLNVDTRDLDLFGTPTRALLVNDSIPGTEIRYTEGDMFKVLLNNTMQNPCTVHWHGMIVPNYMDGVPKITQYPLAPGQSVFMEYPLRQTGSCLLYTSDAADE